MISSRKKSRSGQALILVMAVMVIGLLVVMWNFDLHGVISTKVRVGNAGDAAAQSVARWQGITLNVVGELNLIQAAMILSSGSSEESEDAVEESIEDLAGLRSRLVLLGPLTGFFEAQSVAKLNMSQKDIQQAGSRYASEIISLAELFESGVFGGNWLYLEYGVLLEELAARGVVVQCANLMNPAMTEEGLPSHILYDPEFYDAVSSADWCWFVQNGYEGLLSSFSDESSWDSLPELDSAHFDNGVFFGLGVTRVTNSISALEDDNEAGNVPIPDAGDLEELLEEDATDMKGVSTLMAELNRDLLLSGEYIWHFYRAEDWYEVSSPDWLRDGGSIREELSYSGADAPISMEVNADSYTPGIRLFSDVEWKASAKAFGYLDSDTVGLVVPQYFGMVLPAFHEVRLIPNGISSRPEVESSPSIYRHIFFHLPDYMENGLDAIVDNACPYCNALEIWHNPSFRETGASWVESNKESCEESEIGDEGGTGEGGIYDWR